MPNQEKELEDLYKFTNLLKEVVTLKHLDPPYPDFCIETSTSKIGLEHTELIYSDDFVKMGILSKSQVYRQNQIINKLHDEFSSIDDLKAIITLSFSNQKINKNSHIEIVQEFKYLVNSNLLLIYSLQLYKSIDLDYNKYNCLTKHFDRISVFRNQKQSWAISNWLIAEDGYSSDILLSTINKKNKKVYNYDKNYFDEVWLLIVYDDTKKYSYINFDRKSDQKYITTYDKIYLMNISTNHIKELPTIKQVF